MSITASATSPTPDLAPMHVGSPTAFFYKKKAATLPAGWRNEGVTVQPDSTARAQAELVADVAAWNRRHDEAAARRIMAALYPRVIAIVRRRLPRRVAEEDLAQEVFVRLFERLREYDGRAPLEHWVARMTVNVCIDHLRAEKRRPELRWADLSEGEADVLTATLAGPDAEVGDGLAARQLVEKLLDTLCAEDRLVVTLLDLEGRPVADVCKLTGWSSAAIRVRAFRARRRLRKELLRLEKKK